jgi:hypothetical protein
MLKIIGEKVSKSIAYRISKGLFNPHNSFKNGNYISKISRKQEHYDSSYELLRMKQLDSLKIPWTKKHGIVIKYKNIKGKIKRYIPDFLVSNSTIEEVKPKYLVENYIPVKIKIKAGKLYCKQNGYKFKIITEKELGIK